MLKIPEKETSPESSHITSFSQKQLFFLILMFAINISVFFFLDQNREQTGVTESSPKI
jgi:hypothetical protein